MCSFLFIDIRLKKFIEEKQELLDEVSVCLLNSVDFFFGCNTTLDVCFKLCIIINFVNGFNGNNLLISSFCYVVYLKNILEFLYLYYYYYLIPFHTNFILLHIELKV